MNFNRALQAKFPHLEVSCLKLSEVQKDNETKRIDSEYFKKEYLENEDKIKNLDYCKIKNICHFICNGDDCREYTEIGKHYVRTGDIKDFGLDLDTTETISLNFVSKTKLEIGDLLITRKGNYGKSQVVDREEILNSVISSEIFQLKLKSINPYYVDVFLKSEYGQLQFEKHIHGVSNFSVTQEALLTFLIPLLPMDFQLEIEKLVKDSHFALEQSKELYKEAQNMLYIELGLNPDNPLQSILDFHPTPKEQNSKLTQKSLKQNLNISIRTLKESLGTSGRLDSEYYQSKYDKIESYIKNYKEGFNKLELIEIKDSNFTPKTKEKYRYIELANIGANGSISAPLEEFGKDLPTRARRIVKEGDLIVSSIEGSLSSCALITQEFDDCIVSTGFYVLKSLHINSETLLVLFKSQVFQEYLKKFPSGTILTAISKDELQNILIPKIDFKTQEKIATLIQESFALRAKAKTLLDEAKARVENAINDRKI